MSHRVPTGRETTYPVDGLKVSNQTYARLTGFMPAPPQKEKPSSSNTAISSWAVPVTSKTQEKSATPNPENISKRSRSSFFIKSNQIVPTNEYDNPESKGGKKKAAPKKKKAVKAAPKKKAAVKAAGKSK